MRAAGDLQEHDADEQRDVRPRRIELAVGHDPDDGAPEQRSADTEHGDAEKQDVGDASGAGEAPAALLRLVEEDRNARILHRLSAEHRERLILLGMGVDAELVEAEKPRQQCALDGLAGLQKQQRDGAPAAERQGILHGAGVDPRLKEPPHHGERTDERHHAAGDMPDEQGKPFEPEQEQSRQRRDDGEQALEHGDQGIETRRGAELREIERKREKARTDALDRHQHDHGERDPGSKAPYAMQQNERYHEAGCEQETAGEDERGHGRHQAALLRLWGAAKPLREEIAASHLGEAHRQR